MQVKDVLSYPRSKLCFSSNATGVFGAGGGVRLFSLLNDQAAYLEEEDGAGFSAYCTDFKSKTIALAPRKMRAPIILRPYEDAFNGVSAVKTVLENGVAMAYASIAMDRAGKMVAGIGDEVDHSIVVFDVVTGALLAKMSLPFPCESVSFNDANPMQLCTSGKKGAILWKLEKLIDTYSLLPVTVNLDSALFARTAGDGAQAEGDQAAEENTASWEILALRRRVLCHRWTTRGTILLATASQELFEVHAASGKIREQYIVNPDQGVVRMNGQYLHPDHQEDDVVYIGLTTLHVILVFRNGTIIWLSESDICLPPLKSSQLFSRDRDDEADRLAYSKDDVLCVAMNAGYDRMLVGTKSGRLLHAFMDDFSSVGPDDVDMQVLPTREFHSGRTMGICSVPTEEQEDLFVTVGDDGRILVRNGTSEKLRAHLPSFTLGSDAEETKSTALATACCSLPDRPVVAVGYSTGHVCLVALAKDSVWELRQFWQKRVSAKSVSAMAAAESIVAVASGVAGKVFILDTAVLTNPRVLAHAETVGGSAVTAVAWHDNNSKVLVFACAKGLVYTLPIGGVPEGASPVPASGIFQMPNLVPAMQIAAFPPLGKGVHIVVSPESGDMYALEIPTTKTDVQEDLRVVRTLPHQNAALTAVSVAANECCILVGDLHGHVYVYNVLDGEPVLEQRRRFHQAPVFHLATLLSQSKGFAVYLDGTTVSLQALSLIPQVPDPCGAFTAMRPPKIAIELSSADSPWLQTQQSAEADERKRHSLAALDRRKRRVQDIQDSLQQLLKKNTSAPEMERLAAEEFVIDEEGARKWVHAIEQEAEQLKAETVQHDEDTLVLAARLREVVYDPLEEPLCVIQSFRTEMDDADDAAPLPPVATVENFVIPKRSEKELKQLERVKRIRMLELRAVAPSSGLRRCWPGLMREVPEALSWVLNEQACPPEIDIIGELTAESTKKDSGDATGGTVAENAEAEEDGDEEDTRSIASLTDDSDLRALLYPPIAVRTPHQHRVQLLLLGALVTKVKQRFNERFQELRSEKQNALFAVEEKYSRMREVSAELQLDATAWHPPALAPEETPDSFLKVEPHEVSSRPYESAAELRAKREEEARRKALEAERGVSLEQRALQDMMHGTLEVKKDNLATAMAPQPPDFMQDETPQELWTEEQTKEAEAFQASLKTFMEEQDKHRKALGLELKKLHTEALDVMRSFNDKVETLREQRVHVLYIIAAQELYMAGLAHKLAADEDCEAELRRLDTERLALRDRQIRLHERGVEFQSKVRRFKEELQQVQEDHRAMERSFKREMQDIATVALDQDTLLILMETFQQPFESAVGDGHSSTSGGGHSSQRRSAAGSISRRPSYRARQASNSNSRRHSRATRGSTSSVNDALPSASVAGSVADKSVEDSTATAAIDPYAIVDEALQKKNEALHAPFPEVPPAFVDPEMLEIVEPHVLDRMQELRATKIHREMMIRRKNLELAALRKQNDRLLAEQDDVARQIARVEGDRVAVREAAEKRKWDPNFVVRLAQGQDESPYDEDKEIQNYTDVKLIAVNLVENINQVIRRLGEDKVKTLVKIKEYRKKINYMEWENSYMEMQESSIEQKYKDLQLMRVTKNLQAALKGEAGSEKDRERVERLEARMTMIDQAHKSKVDTIRQQARKIAVQLRDRKQENEQLLRQLRDLETAVSIREGIFKSRLQASGGDVTSEAEATTRMRKITGRRRLVDITKAQTDELDYLRQELERLRQRTFPSFAYASRGRQGP